LLVIDVNRAIVGILLSRLSQYKRDRESRLT
jgi:hypothetical protein